VVGEPLEAVAGNLVATGSHSGVTAALVPVASGAEAYRDLRSLH
jgi:hypothetical protein